MDNYPFWHFWDHENWLKLASVINLTFKLITPHENAKLLFPIITAFLKCYLLEITPAFDGKSIENGAKIVIHSETHWDDQLPVYIIFVLSES